MCLFVLGLGPGEPWVLKINSILPVHSKVPAAGTDKFNNAQKVYPTAGGCGFVILIPCLSSCTPPRSCYCWSDFVSRISMWEAWFGSSLIFYFVMSLAWWVTRSLFLLEMYHRMLCQLRENHKWSFFWGWILSLPHHGWRNWEGVIKESLYSPPHTSDGRLTDWVVDFILHVGNQEVCFLSWFGLSCSICLSF